MYEKIYDGDKQIGKFNMEEGASFTLNTLDIEVPWEFIYQNRNILLKVDQNGPVYAQANPPQDIMLFKRQPHQKYSSWLVWIKSDEINEGRAFNNFFRPILMDIPDVQPQNIEITYRAEDVTYSFEIDKLKIETQLWVPKQGIDIIMQMKITNLRGKDIKLKVLPALNPYISQAQLAPWDKPELYMKTKVVKEEQIGFSTLLYNANTDKSERKAVVYWGDLEGAQFVSVNYEQFVGQGDFFNPKGIYKDHLEIAIDQVEGWENNKLETAILGYQPVYAIEYEWELGAGESKQLTQTLSMVDLNKNYLMPELEVAQRADRFFNLQQVTREKEEVKTFFTNMFSKRTIKTNDNFFDYYVNNWVMLQMYWVAALDRGWPTGMRGVRDSANDFTAMAAIDAKWSKEVLINLMSCQRTDGWFPRQVSTKGKKGKHDLREYVDGGVIFIEFIYEYLGYTGDYELLFEELEWLDSSSKASVLEHVIRAIDYYITDENIGEHGLCKVREGDWLDSVNRAGVLGRGETVMVTNQAIIALNYICAIIDKLIEKGFLYGNEELKGKVKTYKNYITKFKNNLNTYAYNKSGYYNSVFTDKGEWVFSDQDPDGVKRLYGPSNWFSIISGTAQSEQIETVLDVARALKGETGYKLYWPPIQVENPINNLGRCGSGDLQGGLGENGTVYNHGSQGFLARALSVAKKGDWLFEVLQWMMPYNQDKHPTSIVKTPPYAILNCWQEVPGFNHRGGASFLTGSTAMIMRAVYQWMLGIKPSLEGIIMDPCLPEYLNEVKVNMQYKKYPVEIHMQNTYEYSKEQIVVSLNGEIIEDRQVDPITHRLICIVKDECFKDEKNRIDIKISKL